MSPKPSQSSSISYSSHHSSPRQLQANVPIDDFRNTQVAIEECRRRCRVSYREHYASQPTSSPRKRKTSKTHSSNSSYSPGPDFQEMRQLQGLYGEIQQSHAFDQSDDNSIRSGQSEDDERDERSHSFNMYLESEKENRQTSYR